MKSHLGTAAGAVLLATLHKALLVNWLYRTLGMEIAPPIRQRVDFQEKNFTKSSATDKTASKLSLPSLWKA